MDERTMFELLEIYDAKQSLEKVQEMLTGAADSSGYGEGILGNLSYVTDIIMRHSLLYLSEEEYGIGTFWSILEDGAMDNHRKSRLLLGLET